MEGMMKLVSATNCDDNSDVRVGLLYVRLSC